LLSLLVEKI